MPLTSVRYPTGFSTFRAVIPRGPTEYSVTPMQFGAAGDGIVDDAVAVQAAMTAMGSAGGIVVVDRPYKCNSQLTNPDGASIQGFGTEAFLDFSGATGLFPDAGCVVCKGAISAIGVAFNADPIAGDPSITFVAPHGLVEGDIFCPFETAIPWSPHGTNRKGEWCRVARVSGNTVILERPLYDSYAAATCSAYKMIPWSSGFIQGIQIIGIGASTIIPLSLIACADIEVSDVTIPHPCSQYAGIAMTQSIGVKLYNPHVRDSQANISLNYGVLVNSSQDILVTGGDIVSTRHGTAVGNNGVVPFPVNRAVKFVESRISSFEHAAADLHPDAEFCVFENCELPQGVIIGGDNNSVLNSQLGGNRSNGRAIWMSGCLGYNHTFEGLKIKAAQNCSGSPSALIYADIQAGGSITRPGTTMRFSDIAFDLGAFSGELANIIHRATENDLSIELAKITVTGDLPLVADESWTIGTFGASAWKNISVSNFKSTGRNVSIRNCAAERVTVNDVAVTDCHGYGVDISGQQPVPWSKQEFLVSSSLVTEVGKTAFYLNGSEKAKSNLIVSDCIGVRSGKNASGTDDNRCSFAIIGFTNAELSRCKYGDDSGPIQTRSLYLSDITNFVEEDNVDLSAAVLGRTEVGITNHKKRFIRPTVKIVGDFVLSAGWGSTASVSAIAAQSNDNGGEITVTSAGVGQAADPTITMVYTGFHNAPRFIFYRNGGSQLTVPISWIPGGSSVVLTFHGIPVAAETYTFGWRLEG